MKVLFHLHNRLSYWGGGERQIATYAEYLRRQGNDVTIHCLPLLQDDKGVTNTSQVETRTSFFYDDRDYDVLYSVYHPLCGLFLHSDTPSIAGLHSNLLWFVSLSTAIRHHYGLIPLLNKVVNPFTQAYTLSKFDAVHMNTPVLENRIHHDRKYVIPNTVDTEYFRPTVSKADKFTILFVGRHSYDKGFDTFVHLALTFSNWHKKDTQVLYTGAYAGTGTIAGLGYVTNLPDLYSKAHLTVYPTRSDTFGNVIIESLACGTPVLTSDIPVHQAINVPIGLASSFIQYLTIIENWYQYWRQGKNADREILRRYALPFSVGVLGGRFETMLREVAA